MRASAKIFWILGVFFLIVAVAYGFVTGRYEPMGIEPVGFPALLALAGLGFMIAIILYADHPSQRAELLRRFRRGDRSECGRPGQLLPVHTGPAVGCDRAALCFLGVAAGGGIFAFGIMFAIFGILSWVLEFSVGQHQHSVRPDPARGTARSGPASIRRCGAARLCAEAGSSPSHRRTECGDRSSVPELPRVRDGTRVPGRTARSAERMPSRSRTARCSTC